MKKLANFICKTTFVIAFVYLMIALTLGIDVANNSAITFIKTILSWF